jgi:hypothetical protein
MQAEEKVRSVGNTEECHIHIRGLSTSEVLLDAGGRVDLSSIQMNLIYINLIRKKMVGSIRLQKTSNCYWKKCNVNDLLWRRRIHTQCDCGVKRSQSCGDYHNFTNNGKWL